MLVWTHSDGEHVPRGQPVSRSVCRMPLIGVVARGRVTWPGDDRPPSVTSRLAQLQSDHTHFVMLETDDDSAADAYRFRLTSAILSRGALSMLFLVPPRACPFLCSAPSRCP